MLHDVNIGLRFLYKCKFLHLVGCICSRPQTTDLSVGNPQCFSCTFTADGCGQGSLVLVSTRAPLEDAKCHTSNSCGPVSFKSASGYLLHSIFPVGTFFQICARRHNVFLERPSSDPLFQKARPPSLSHLL